MKLNITPGPWEYLPFKFNTDNRENVSIGSITTSEYPVWYIAEIQSCCGHHKLEDQTESEANAAAIVTAVNNTYHKGINPEAVPDMLEVLKDARLEQYLPFEIYKKLTETIQKATL